MKIEKLPSSKNSVNSFWPDKRTGKHRPHDPPALFKGKIKGTKRERFAGFLWEGTTHERETIRDWLNVN